MGSGAEGPLAIPPRIGQGRHASASRPPKRSIAQPSRAKHSAAKHSRAKAKHSTEAGRHCPSALPHMRPYAPCIRSYPRDAKALASSRPIPADAPVTRAQPLLEFSPPAAPLRSDANPSSLEPKPRYHMRRASGEPTFARPSISWRGSPPAQALAGQIDAIGVVKALSRRDPVAEFRRAR